MDYSKGLPEKLKALDFLWERYPELREVLTFVEVAVPSRTDIAAYDELTHKGERLAGEANERYGTPPRRPLHLVAPARPAARLPVPCRAAESRLPRAVELG